MNTLCKGSAGRHALLSIMGLVVWLPIISIALLFGAVRLATGLGEGILVVAATLGLLMNAEVVATLIFFIYACCAKPWRFSKKWRLRFYTHALAGGMTTLLIVALEIAFS
ncbi:hypothetical protein NLO83_09185 [Pseudomonas tremae]|uniref:hypothetical protein n=1 Tax=Pseudomonas syringae group TaxID=136849 RepID=UPI0001AF5CD3|nr:MULTISPECIES: hypothetical protein [Pseudomonas syringae group]MCQ3015775.1 hypothetical protein [Pseudomonas tremae]QGL55725.1 hypothetical protein POR16_04940 [Pseudomonas coronafaciens pv. oryzae str. 1_6]